MAVAYASHTFNTPSTNAGGGDADHVNIAKPLGTVSGDLLIAHLATKTSTDAWAPPSGWTLITSSNTADHVLYYKIAGGSEPSAYEFVRTSSEIGGGSIIRITGGSTTFTFDADVAASNAGGSPLVFSGGVTPAANSLLLLFTASYSTGNNTMTISSQAIVTSNPSWTELYDGGTTSDVDLWMSAAYAIRPQATATGNYQVNIATTSGNTDGILLAIAPSVSVTVSPAVISAVITVQAPSVTGGATVSPAVIAMNVTVQAPIVSTPASDVVNESRTSVSGTNETKHTATPTNESKHTASVINEPIT